MLEDIMSGFAMMLTPTTILLAIFGVILGSVLGAIPGLSATMVIALLIPFTFSLNVVGAVILLSAMYKGGIFGGSIAAILLNTPGTSAAAATALDGHQLAKQGKAGKAIKMAIVSSSLGDLFACFVLIFAASIIAKFALRFGPPEYAALILFAFTVVLGVSQKSLVKGLLATALGILFATVGYDPTNGVPRFSFSSMHLSSGIDLIPMLIGLLAVSEIFLQMEKKIKEFTSNRQQKIEEQPMDDSKLTWKEIKGVRKIIFQSAGIGTFIGSLPGLGPTAAAFLGYNNGKRLSKDSKKYGKGSLEGVAAPEAANSAVGSSNLIPLISLGIPGDAEAALILAALTIHGITPGPQIFENNGPIIYGIYAGLLIAILANFTFNWYFSKYAMKIRHVNMNVIIPAVLLFCVVGSYGINQSIFDVKIMLFFGILGYLMLKFKIPTTPLLIGFILAPIFEKSVRQSLIISRNDIMIFFERPISLTFIIITVLVVGFYIYKEVKNKMVEAE